MTTGYEMAREELGASFAAETLAMNYAECMLWIEAEELDPDGNGLNIYELPYITIKKIVRDCEAFIVKAGDMLEECGLSQAGHDFWLTRNGHGAGFWDGDWPINGDALTAIANEFGEAYVYLCDDGLIYLS